MCNLLKQFGPLAGRALMAAIFIVSGFGKIAGFAGTSGYMASKGLPFVPVLLVLTIIIELGGGLMLLLGIKARWAATVLLLFLIPVTFIFHAFWTDPATAQMQQIMFMKNLAIMGGLLYVAAFGAGPHSLAHERDC